VNVVSHVLNVADLPEVVPVWPGAAIGLVSPLGDGLRSLKGTTPVDPVIDRFIVHHTATTSDQAAYFSVRNDRSSCPTWYLRTDGDAIEFIRPGMKPASSGPDWNWRSVAVEILDADTSWRVTDIQLERVAQMIAWLATFNGKTLDGIRVDFQIDRTHVIGHREFMATECPGDFVFSRLDDILARAREINSPNGGGSSMVSYQYTTINGQRVEKNVADAFKKWAADFKKATGEDLFVTSGTRTKAEQQAGYEKYLKGQTGGVKWAKPTESSHCEVGPSGPRALDLRDSGKDNGVTVKGTKRWNAAVSTGKAHGFTWGGWGVPDNEGWHFENHVVKVGVYGGGSGLGAKQRKAKAFVNRRKTPDTKTAPMKDGLPKGTVGNFTGWRNGQKVEGNDIWFRGISGNWFWSGGFEGGANTSGLPKV
jgi:hypothetical protein